MSVGQLEAYAAADPLYFDSPTQVRPRGEVLAALELPPGWSSFRRGIWEVAQPPDGAPRETGWKIHVAADPSTAARVDEVVVPFCLEHDVAFKRLVSLEVVTLMNAKYAPRTSSGKFITIYPRDDEELVRICAELHPQLAELHGPRVLTDLAWLGGPLSIRYGPFRGVPYVDDRGAPGQLMRMPDGELRPDDRRPTFTHPYGVALPAGFCTAAVPAADASLSRYERLTVLHFSNSGGVYRAWRADLERWVVLKEARPRTGLDRIGRDAQERLHNESRALRGLRDVVGIPDHIEDLELQGHRFTVMAHVEGESAYAWAGSRQPLSNYCEAEESELRRYVADVDAVIASLDRTVAAMHAAGWASDDLHPGNVIVGPDGAATIIDLEAAKPADAATDASFQVAGFGSAGETAGARDAHALDMLALWFFLPLSRVVSLDRSQLREHVAWVLQRYPLTANLAPRLERLAATAPAGERPGTSVAALTAGIVDAATPQRHDRLFPGAVEAFTYGHGSLGYGSAGTLWALSRVGQRCGPSELAWLTERLAAPTGYHGLYVGDAGTIWCAAQLGAPTDAVCEAADRLVASWPPTPNTLSVWGGLAGDGLALLGLDALAPGAGYAGRALEHAERCRRELDGERRLPVGYLHGWSGIAHFLLMCFRHTRDDAWLGLAVRALARDVDSCTAHPRSGVRVALPDGRRISYLGGGSGGVAAVADEILVDADVPRLIALLPGWATACSRTIVGHAGMATGRAGTMAVLSRLVPRLQSLGTDTLTHQQALRTLKRHRAMLDHHLVARGEGLAVPGDQSLRLSTDLLHGAAGVLLAVAQIEHGTAFLPFFTDRDPVIPATPATASSGGSPEESRGGQHADR